MTDQLLFDTDEDGLNDGDEINKHKTNPLVADTDEDGLSDWDEISRHKTNHYYLTVTRMVLAMV
ncbi:hypothetical protein OAF43_02300 [bacterium]|nr:hypothetical protein [bacterium]